MEGRRGGGHFPHNLYWQVPIYPSTEIDNILVDQFYKKRIFERIFKINVLETLEFVIGIASK